MTTSLSCGGTSGQTCELFMYYFFLDSAACDSLSAARPVPLPLHAEPRVPPLGGPAPREAVRVSAGRVHARLRQEEAEPGGQPRRRVAPHGTTPSPRLIWILAFQNVQISLKCLFFSSLINYVIWDGCLIFIDFSRRCLILNRCTPFCKATYYIRSSSAVSY